MSHFYHHEATYSGLEASDFLIGQGVRLGNDRNEVHLGVEAAHNLNVKRLEGVASWLNEENTSVNSVVDNVHAVNLVLSVKVGVEALLNVVDNRAPRLVVVDKVAKARGVDDGETETNTSLFNIGTDGLDGNSLGNDVQGRLLALLGGVERGVEQGVDKSRLSEARFTLKVSV